MRGAAGAGGGKIPARACLVFVLRLLAVEAAPAMGKNGRQGEITLQRGSLLLEGETELQAQLRLLKQLESIQQGSPKNIVILGTRHCSFLHQQIIELLSFALVLSDNHIFTSGATGTHAAAIRGALRAGNQELLTVILPQTIQRQPQEIRDLLGQARAPLPPSPNTHSARCPRHRTAARALSRAAATARRSTA